MIDGQTQPNYAGTPLVEIDVGGQGAFGLLVIGNDSAGTEVRGIAIYGGNSVLDFAIDFDNPGENVVERNFIGTDASGTTAKGRGGVTFGWVSGGDGFVSSDNRIVDNVIAGTTVAGVHLEEASDNQVLRNLIGTDASGTVGLSDGLGTGIDLTTGSSRDLLANNLIAAKNEGITIRGPSSDNRIEGNLIGTDITGTVDRGNSTWGIGVFDNVSGTLIGGAAPSLRNVISGNDGAGITLTRAAGTVVRGNLIGTDGTGTSDRPNGGPGVSLGQTTGLTLITDNVISGNDGPGISGGATAGGSLHIEATYRDERGGDSSRPQRRRRNRGEPPGRRGCHRWREREPTERDLGKPRRWTEHPCRPDCGSQQLHRHEQGRRRGSRKRWLRHLGGRRCRHRDREARSGERHLGQ